MSVTQRNIEIKTGLTLNKLYFTLGMDRDVEVDKVVETCNALSTQFPLLLSDVIDHKR